MEFWGGIVAVCAATFFGKKKKTFCFLSRDGPAALPLLQGRNVWESA
ncbi:unnamed protein product [Amoebophrya sp. A25]|nr:unnamed protein product [Amoebophrya sp. A25]|eukprot:GSA25T00019915001.1